MRRSQLWLFSSRSLSVSPPSRMDYSTNSLRLSIFIISLSLLALSSLTTADDAAVMGKLLSALSPTPSGWSASTHPCTWINVVCNTNNRVTAINLISMSLSGTLPSDLGSLTQLTVLSLQRNSLSGPLPSLANLTLLQQLYLDNNNFNSIPDGFFQGLTSLQILLLSQNTELAPWTIPTELTQATSLVVLYASSANVVGSFPDIFGSFPRLKDLRLSYNKLTGPLPKSFRTSAIEILWLDNQENGLSGNIDVLSSMIQLSEVWLQKNQFEGPIPDLSKCTNLSNISLANNGFVGTIPDSLTTLSDLQLLDLSNNNLTGSIPKFRSTVTIIVSGNPSLGKTIPSPGSEGRTSSASNWAETATGRATRKVDVYAFGVVLMELITGRKPVYKTIADEWHSLVRWFRRVLINQRIRVNNEDTLNERVLINKENLPAVLDQTLNPDEDGMDSIYKVAELAVHCTAHLPHQRPDMEHAVNMLGPLVEEWQPSYQVAEESFGIRLYRSLPQTLREWQSDEDTSAMFNGIPDTV